MLRVQVCDGCCCGTDRKHPGVDHEEIRQRLAAAVTVSGGTCRVVGCVDECSRSNVVVVRPTGATGDRIWVGGVLGDDIVTALCDWLALGAPSPIPGTVTQHVFERSAARVASIPVSET